MLPDTVTIPLWYIAVGLFVLVCVMMLVLAVAYRMGRSDARKFFSKVGGFWLADNDGEPAEYRVTKVVPRATIDDLECSQSQPIGPFHYDAGTRTMSL